MQVGDGGGEVTQPDEAEAGHEGVVTGLVGCGLSAVPVSQYSIVQYSTVQYSTVYYLSKPWACTILGTQVRLFLSSLAAADNCLSKCSCKRSDLTEDDVEVVEV